MTELIIGGAVAAGFGYLIIFCRDRGLQLNWFQWFLLVLEGLFIIFWLEVIVAFVKEGMLKGALVNGILIGLMVSIFGVLLYRLLFKGKLKKKQQEKI